MKIILEMANNHMGDVDHGLKLISELARVTADYEFDFFVKYQFRDLETLIHDEHKGSDLKYIRRFEETVLTEYEWQTLIDLTRQLGFGVMVTPFDEASVDKMNALNVADLKIASCSMADWPLFEKVAQSWDGPVTMSTGGAGEDIIDRSVSFFTNRNFDLTLMHCVALYPTETTSLSLGQVEYFRRRYSGVKVGYSTHESPSDTISGPMAYALGARTFEKHVGLATDQYQINEYSLGIQQLENWLFAMRQAESAIGSTEHRRDIGQTEADSILSLARGVYLRNEVSMGRDLHASDLYLAMPASPDSYSARDLSKYATFDLKRRVKKDQALRRDDAVKVLARPAIERCHDQVAKLIKDSGITVPKDAVLELSHHYGVEKFSTVGLGMITVVNESYCKKLLFVLPGQTHPEQYHKVKEETFNIIWGSVTLILDGEHQLLESGDVTTIAPMVKHSFASDVGCVLEEISTTHSGSDSYYVDESINKNKDRKTFVRLDLK